MRNLKFVRYSAVLLGLVVLRTKVQNGFCPMRTKGCCMVLNRSNPFWGQFWGQICETDSHTHRSYKYAALVSLRNTNINITRFSHRKSPTNRYISFTLRQEAVRKHYSAALPHTAPVAARNASVWARSQSVSTDARPAIYRPKFPAFGAFCPRTAFPAQALPRRVSPVQEKPALINTKKQIRILSYLQNIQIRALPPESCRDAYNLIPESTTYDCT